MADRPVPTARRSGSGHATGAASASCGARPRTGSLHASGADRAALHAPSWAGRARGCPARRLRGLSLLRTASGPRRRCVKASSSVAAAAATVRPWSAGQSTTKTFMSRRGCTTHSTITTVITPRLFLLRRMRQLPLLSREMATIPSTASMRRRTFPTAGPSLMPSARRC